MSMKYLGVDWGSRLHLAVLIDEQHEVLQRWEVEHEPEAVSQLVHDLERHGGPTQIRVAIEPGAALFMEALQQAGYTLYPINPKQLDRHRDRYFPAGAKDDARDALVAAMALADDQGRLRPLEPQDDRSEELVARAQARLRLVEHRVALDNQLRAVLQRFYPAVLALERSLHDAFLLDLLRAYPDPEAGRRGRGRRIQRLLETHHIRRLTASGVLEVLRAPAFAVREPIQAACRDELRNLVAQLQQLNEQIREADKRMEALFEEHPDRALFLSLPGMGTQLAIRVGLRLGRNRIEGLETNTLRALAGTAPVTISTGRRPRRPGQRLRHGSRIVAMRRACDRQLQADVSQWAAQSRRTCAWAQACYLELRARGQGHNAALRQLGDKWIPILAAVIRTHTPYDDERYNAVLARHGVSWAQSPPPPNEEAA